MQRMGTFLKYVIWIILFYIFSNFLIEVNIESTYKDIGRKDNLPQVTVYQAQATKVNGRIKGTIYNNSDNKITNKYLKIDLYSERGVNLGSRYIDVSSIRENTKQDFETYFKVKDVSYYEMQFTDEKQEGELPEVARDLTRGEVVWGTIIALMLIS